MNERIANISYDTFNCYTGTPIPTNYKFVCWVGDEKEEELLDDVMKADREIIQVTIPGE